MQALWRQLEKRGDQIKRITVFLGHEQGKRKIKTEVAPRLCETPWGMCCAAPAPARWPGSSFDARLAVQAKFTSAKDVGFKGGDEALTRYQYVRHCSNGKKRWQAAHYSAIPLCVVCRTRNGMPRERDCCIRVVIDRHAFYPSLGVVS